MGVDTYVGCIEDSHRNYYISINDKDQLLDIFYALYNNHIECAKYLFSRFSGKYDISRLLVLCGFSDEKLEFTKWLIEDVKINPCDNISKLFLRFGRIDGGRYKNILISSINHDSIETARYVLNKFPELAIEPFIASRDNPKHIIFLCLCHKKIEFLKLILDVIDINVNSK